MISIIVPVYNAERFLDSCVESIIAQTYSDWELILVNDGSNDGSGAICDYWQNRDSRIHSVHKENGGVTAARKAGVICSKGEWVVFVDADDTLVPECLFILYNNRAGVDTVCATIMTSTGNVWYHSRTGILNRDEYLKSLIDGSVFGFAYATLFKRDLFIGNVFSSDKTLAIGEDVLMRIELAINGVACNVINEAVYLYRYNEFSAMSTKLRSPMYYKRYFVFRDQLIGEKCEIDTSAEDFKAVYDSFFSEQVPLKREYVSVLRFYYNKLSHKERASLPFRTKLKVIVALSPVAFLVKRGAQNPDNVRIID